MIMSKRHITVLSIAVAGGLGACSKIPDWDNRYGPGPNLSREKVEERIKRQEELMSALRGYVIASDKSATAGAITAEKQAMGDTSVWYRAAELGFNYADEECNEYLRLNFRLTRIRDRDHSLFEQVGNASPGLLKAAAVTDPTITTIGAALGLGKGLSDAYMNSYLFSSMEPNVVFRTVTKLQNAYRAEAKTRKASFDSSAAAYRAIQNYYSLCFPQTIEAKMSEYLAGSITDTEKDSGPKPRVIAETSGNNLLNSATTIDPKLRSPD